MEPPPLKRVPAEVLRHLFNHGNYWARAKAGDLSQHLLRERHPALPLAPVPYFTKSQLIAYWDAGGQEVARVHQYLLPDGTIGASGMPDPKRLLHEGTLYRLERQKAPGN
jgi:hypothetical protein